MLNETSYTRYQLWRNGVTVEAEMVGFTFDQEKKLGIIGLCYEVDGTTYESQIEGFFSDFQQIEPVPVLIAADDPEQSYWKSPERFWFLEIIILTVWSFLLVKLTAGLFISSQRQSAFPIV